MTRPNETDLTLRACAAEDIAGVHAIYSEAVCNGTASFELTPPGPEEMAERWQALRGAGYPYLVALVGGAVAGYAYAGAYRPRPAYRGAVENSVYVRKDCQGKGVGRALLAELIARCEAAGFRQMVAVIGDSDNHGSIGLHRALGFADVGVLRAVGWKHGRWLDTVLMQLPLGPGDGAPFEG
ncbi:GNAT family N-acetyltransferase [Antarcticimicrobium luteum]|uniref:N-acetyltransferase family protein n=1 Tax=Antarcticimicrobium luteum TaxID=2547397 RepID=A0A4R5UVB1_9RHOB|nr:GNAT family N-acetyltransferase [Antarcticimicrobium luteum]TDK43163.1 N-acetyltransferase family protein [Antarcticimicrobium luteum]